MKIGLFFGSFNPIHIGHLAIANYMTECTDLDEVWLVVSPQNPFKSKQILANAKKRLAIVRRAVKKHPKIKICDVEFTLPQPSYTINTLETLKKKYPKNKFILIIGTDNLNSFHKWKDYRKILDRYNIYIYPRMVITTCRISRCVKNHKNIHKINAPRIDISSTFIREQIKKGKNMSCFLP